MGIQINGNTNNINAGIGSLSIEDLNELDIVGVATASNFKTGSSNLHSTGLTLTGGQLDVGSNIKIGTAGVVTATRFVGSVGTFTGDTAISGSLQIADTIQHESDVNTKIRFPANDTFSVETSGSERLRIDSSGRVGINSTSPSTPLEIHTAASAAWKFRINTSVSDGAGFYQRANGEFEMVLRDTSNNVNYIAGTSGGLQFTTSSTEKVRIDSSGRLLVGQTSAIQSIYGSPPPRFSVSTTTASPAIFATYSNNTYASRVDLIKSRNTTVGSHTVVQAGDALGELYFGGSDGDQYLPGALIQSVVESGVGDNDMPADLRFFTNAGATTISERLRIEGNGQIWQNYGRPSSDARFKFDKVDAGSCGTEYYSGGAQKAYIMLDSEENMTYLTQAGTNHRFWTNGSSVRMQIDGNGYVTKPAHPAFFVTMNGADQTTAAANIMPFDTVVHNNGGHYKTSGSDIYNFVCPVAGYYFFGGQVWLKHGSGTGNHARWEIWRDTTIVALAGWHQNGVNLNDHQSATSVTIYCDAGAKVYMEADYALSYWRGGPTNPHTFFHGHLIA